MLKNQAINENIKFCLSSTKCSESRLSLEDSKISQRKNQSLSKGAFYPEGDTLNVYKCVITNTTGFLKDISLFTVLIGFFAFFLTGWLALIIIPISWLFLIAYLMPKHYKYLQLNKYSAICGTGSFKHLILSKFSSLYPQNKFIYKDIVSIRFNKWEKGKRGGKKDLFGKIEIRTDLLTTPFSFLTTDEELSRLVKIFDKHRFDTKVNKIRSRGELILIFPNSPRYNN